MKTSSLVLIFSSLGVGCGGGSNDGEGPFTPDSGFTDGSRDAGFVDYDGSTVSRDSAADKPEPCFIPPTDPGACSADGWCPVNINGCTNKRSALNAIWGTSANDVWAVGERKLMVHWNGTEWSTVPVPEVDTAFHFYSIWGLDSNEIWAGGGPLQSGGVTQGQTGTMFKWDGTAWNVLKDWIPSQSGYSADNVMSIAGTKLEGPDTRYPSVSLDGGVTLMTSAAMADIDDTYIFTDSPDPCNLGALYGPLLGQWYGPMVSLGPYAPAFNVRAHGLVVTWGLKDPESFPDAPTADFFADHQFALCHFVPVHVHFEFPLDDGGVQIYDFFQGYQADSVKVSLDSRTIQALWAVDENDVWMVGSAGKIEHVTGTQQEIIPPLTDRDLFSVWGSGPDDVWAVGSGGTILHWNGTRWAKEDSGTKQVLRGVWGNKADHALWAVGTGYQAFRKELP